MTSLIVFVTHSASNQCNETRISPRLPLSRYTFQPIHSENRNVNDDDSDSDCSDSDSDNGSLMDSRRFDEMIDDVIGDRIPSSLLSPVHEDELILMRDSLWDDDWTLPCDEQDDLSHSSDMSSVCADYFDNDDDFNDYAEEEKCSPVCIIEQQQADVFAQRRNELWKQSLKASLFRKLP